MKKIIIILCLLLFNFNVQSQSGIYNISTTEFQLHPNRQTGKLQIITDQFKNDTLVISIWNDRINNNFKKTFITDTIILDFKGYKYENYLLTIYNKKQKIFRKYILIEP